MNRRRESDFRGPIFQRIGAQVLIIGFVVFPDSLLAFDHDSFSLLMPGTWGGRGAELRVTGDVAKVEFDCAYGRIDAPIEIQSNGEFAVTGLYFPESGGPGRVGDPEPAGIPAIFSGIRENAEIRLNVRLIDAGRTVGPYTLYRSKKPELEKCL